MLQERTSYQYTCVVRKGGNVRFGSLADMLHRKIARLLATQNAIDVFGGLAKIIPEVDPIEDEPASRDGAFAGVNRRQAMPPSQRDNEILVGPGDRRREDNDPAIFLHRKRRYGAIDSGGIVNGARYDLDPQARRGLLDRMQKAG